MRPFLLIFLAAIFAIGTCAQVRPGFDISNYGVRVEPDKRLMVVLATLEMAGTKVSDGKLQKLLNAPLSPAGTTFREELLRDTADLPDDLRLRITAFVGQYKHAHPKASDAELIAPFISMAYALTPAPELGDPIVTTDLPGNLLDVLDFAPLVREFYRRSTIASKLDAYIKEYKGASNTQLTASTRDMVGELLDYLHTRPQLIFSEKVRIETQKVGTKQRIATTEIREHDRHFYVVPEALAPRGNVNFLNIRDDYYVIVPPDADLTGPEGRRAFLRFVVDPLVLANAKDMTAIRDWAKPVLEGVRKTDASVSADPFLAVSRSLVAAADVRENEYLKDRIATEQARDKILTMKTDADKRAVSADLDTKKKAYADEAALRLYEDYQDGAVLGFYFADQLKGVEASGFDIASSLKDMVVSFDAAKEADRITSTAEARNRALAARQARKDHPDTAPTAVENPVTTRLLEIQKSIDSRDLAKANSDLKQLLAQYPSEPRIYYNIGRVAGLAAAGIQDPDAQAAKLLEAKVAYTNVLNTSNERTDPALLSLTYVALGRVYEFFNENQTAVALYDRAIRFGDVSGGGFSEAMLAKQRLLKP